MLETTGQEVDIAQLEAKIAQLAEEKREAHDAVASCEYQLDTKRTFTFQNATEEERVWYRKTRYALRKNKQKANDLQIQISKLNAILEEARSKKKMAENILKEARSKKKMAENTAAQEVKYLAFYRCAKAALSKDVFEAILEETIKQGFMTEPHCKNQYRGV